MQCVLNILTTINRIKSIVKINSFIILPEKILKSGIAEAHTGEAATAELAALKSNWAE